MKAIDELKKYVKAQANETIKGMSLHKAYSSFEMLDAVDAMIADYHKDKAITQGAILLDVFGLLQGFFVAIDALYDLAISITKYKYNVNLNLNPVLHELKFIRNDIVGHPTNRTYPDGSIGFSVFKEASIQKDSFSYETYFYQKNKLTVKDRTVVFKELIDNYLNEKEIILEDLRHYCLNIKKDDTYISEIFHLYTKLSKKEPIDHQEISYIKDQFIAVNQIAPNSKHRFLWRIDLIYLLLNWTEEDSDFKEMLDYLLKKQILKIYTIALELEHKRVVIPHVKVPDILKQFYRYIRANEEEAYPYIQSLNDSTHPFYHNDIEALIDLSPPKRVFKLINWLRIQEDSNKAYLIGSTLKEYRKKLSK